MNTEQFEQLVGRTVSSVRSFVLKFTQKRQPQLSSRLDALLLEKAKAEQVEITLKKPVPWVKIASAFFGASVTFAVGVLLIMFVPGPWTRFVAQPQIVTMKLSNVDFTYNGVQAAGTLEIRSPKAVRGVQFVTANLEITPKVEVKVELLDDNRQITVTPLEPLAEGVTYTVTLKPGVLFSDGTYLTNEQSWVIPTKAVFDVLSLSPIDGSTVPMDTTIEVVFSTDEFETSSVMPHVSIVPAVEGTYKKIANRLVFEPKSLWAAGNTYTVTVGGDLASVSGQKISQARTTTFTVIENDPEVPAQPPSLSFEKPVSNVTEGNSAVILESTKVSAVDVSIYDVAWNEVQPAVEQYITKGQLTAESIISKKASVKSIALSGVDTTGNGQYYRFTVPLNGMPAGVYIIKASAANGASRQYAVVFKSTYGVYATPRREGKGLDAWAFSFESLQPQKDVTVSLFGCKGSTCTSVNSSTPDNGYVQIDTDQHISYVVATYQKQAVILFSGLNESTGYTLTGSTEGYPNLFAKIITNKPMYLPGNVLRYSVLLREEAKGGFKPVAQGTPYVVALCEYPDYYQVGVKLSDCIATKTQAVSPTSEISGEFSLWSKREALRLVVLHPDTYEVVASEYISIYEYDKPQASITATFSVDRYVGKQQGLYSGRVTDVAGAGLSQKEVMVTIYARPDGMAGDSVSVLVSKVITDSTGNFTANFSLPVDQAKHYEYILEGTTTYQDGDNYIQAADQSRWDHGDKAIITVFNSDRETTNVPAGKNAQAKVLITLIPSGKPATSRKITVDIRRDYYELVSGSPVYDEATRKMVVPTQYKYRTESVGSQTITTNAEGIAEFSVNSVKEGTYYAVLSDTFGPWKIAQEHMIFYSGATTYGQDLDRSNEWVSGISFDRSIANVGDKATLSINSSFKDTKQQLALLIQTNQVDTWRYISQDIASIDIPITKDMSGGLFVCIVHPMKVSVVEGSRVTPTAKGYALNTMCTSLLVEDQSKKLTVTVAPESNSVAPGKEQSISVSVTDSKKQGVQSIVGVSVVDKAVYQQVAGTGSIDYYYLNLYQELYKSYRNHGRFGMSSVDVRDVLGLYGGMGAAGDGGGVIRSNFDDNPTWKAAMKTDATGTVNIPVQYSDAITTWVVTVWAVTDDLKVGSVTTEVKTTKPVYVSVDSIGIIRPGDSAQQYVRVVNTTDQIFAGTLDVVCDGCMEASEKFTVSLKPKQTVDFQVQISAKTSGLSTLKASLSQNGETKDTIEHSFVVRPLGVELLVQKSAMLGKKGSSMEFTLATDVVPQLTTLTATLSRFPLAPGEYLTIDPSFASTSEISGAIVALTTIKEYNSGDVVGLSPEVLSQKAQYHVQSLLKRMQPNGAFGFYSYQGEEFEPSIEAAYALAMARQTFTDIDISVDTMRILALNMKRIIVSDRATIGHKVRAAYSLAVLDRSGAAAAVTALQSALDKEQLTDEDSLYLALALQRVGATSDAIALVQHVSSSLVSSGSSSYVQSSAPILSSSMYLDLMSSLGLSAQYKQQISAVMQYMALSCRSCQPRFAEGLSMYFYAHSLKTEQQGSSKAEEYVIALNGKEVARVAYNGLASVVRLPADALMANNTLSVTSASGKQLFVTVSGTVYQTTIPKSSGGAFTVTSTLQRASGSLLGNGKTAYYDVIVTANQDVSGGKMQLYIPSGLRSTYVTPTDKAFYDFVTTYKPLWAYGDSSRSDAFSAQFGALKKGQSIHIILPVVAVRKGVYGSELVVVSSNGDSDNRAVFIGNKLTIP